MKSIETIAKTSKFSSAIYSGSLSKDQNSILNIVYQAGTEFGIQIGGEINNGFDSRRPFFHLNNNDDLVNLI